METSLYNIFKSMAPLYKQIVSATCPIERKIQVKYNQLIKKSKKVEYIKTKGSKRKGLICYLKDNTIKGYLLFSHEYVPNAKTFHSAFDRVIRKLPFKKANFFAHAVYEGIVNALLATNEINSRHDIKMEFTINKKYCEVIIVNYGSLSLKKIPHLPNPNDINSIKDIFSGISEYTREKLDETGNYKAGLGILMIDGATDNFYFQDYTDKPGHRIGTRLIMKIFKE